MLYCLNKTIRQPKFNNPNNGMNDHLSEKNYHLKAELLPLVVEAGFLEHFEVVQGAKFEAFSPQTMVVMGMAFSHHWSLALTTQTVP